MKKHFPIAVVMAMVLVAVACGTGPDGATTEAPTAAASRIRAMEDSLYAHPKVDPKGAQALLDVYLLYAKNNPVDSISPEYLLRAAGVKSALNDPQGAIALYDRIIRDYPKWSKTPDAYYLKAFTIDNGLHVKGLAQQAYQQVIDRYPQHRFAADARQMIENLGYTDEELIARFKRMNDSLAPASAVK